MNTDLHGYAARISVAICENPWRKFGEWTSVSIGDNPWLMKVDEDWPLMNTDLHGYGVQKSVWIRG